MTQRRLPVLQSNGVSELPTPRLTWRWVPVGACVILVLWLPLALAALWLASQLSPILTAPNSGRAASLVVVLPIPISYVVACTLGGLVMRRANERIPRAVAALAGSGAGSLACAIAFASGSLERWPLALAAWSVLAPTGALFTSLGHRRGP